jgi:hypothetical protein
MGIQLNTHESVFACQWLSLPLPHMTSSSQIVAIPHTTIVALN